MDSTTPRRTILALAAIALLALPTTAVSGGKDYATNAAAGDYAYGPLPPSGPAKDYDNNAATGDYFGWRYASESEAARHNQPVSPSPAQVVTVAKPGGFDRSDAAIGAGGGIAFAIGALGLTAIVRRRRIVSPTGAGPRGVAR